MDYKKVIESFKEFHKSGAIFSKEALTTLMIDKERLFTGEECVYNYMKEEYYTCIQYYSPDKLANVKNIPNLFGTQSSSYDKLLSSLAIMQMLGISIHTTEITLYNKLKHQLPLVVCAVQEMDNVLSKSKTLYVKPVEINIEEFANTVMDKVKSNEAARVLTSRSEGDIKNIITNPLFGAVLKDKLNNSRYPLSKYTVLSNENNEVETMQDRPTTISLTVSPAIINRRHK